LRLKVDKTKPYGYPNAFESIGDHVKAVRMDRGLRQGDVAEMVGYGVESVLNWEK
jgi:DNA-binding transcriptional regulator YiaG